MISAKPPSGTRDFLPDAVRARRWATLCIERAYEAHGFVPLETPAMERLDVLSGKYGDEGDQLIFRVLKRGDKLPELSETTDPATLTDLGLRYDLTVPLARVVAAHQNALPKYFKRYQIQPVWRADRPQRGRFREFYQCDVDYVGSTSLVAETTVLGAVADALAGLGFQAVTARLNDRRILTGILTLAGVPDASAGDVLVSVDKLDKIGRERVVDELRERGLDDDAITALAPMLDGVGDATPADAIAALRTRLDGISEVGVAGCDALLSLFEMMEAAGAATLRCVFDPTLARGLGYYTGPIFELNVDDLPMAVGGGGRYDGLIGMFRGNQTPAVGCSLGLERLLVVLEERGMLPSDHGASDVVVARMDDDAVGANLALARAIRSAGLRVEVFPDKAKLGKQLQYAESIGARVVVLQGNRELDAHEVQLKDLVTGTQVAVAVQDAPAKALALRSASVATNAPS